jgi:hypothetical protein
MPLQRKRFLTRVIASSFLLVFLQSVFVPYYSFALTHGPHQPEYTAYDEPGATDLVNLVTGDFAFNLPILDVPGPEGNFSVPLTYNAGIGLDQQASWVGLGWNINVGAIVRNINEYPDDANGESKSVTVQDLNTIRGWNSNLGIVQLGWSNQTGHYGSVSLLGILDVSWNEGLSAVGVAGLSVGRDGVGFDPVKFTMAVISVASLGAGSAAVSVAQVATALAIDAGVGLVAAAITGSSAPSPQTAGYWKPTTVTDKKLFHTNHWTWLDHTRTENMYGLLYLANTPEDPYTADQAFNLTVQNGTGTTAVVPKIFPKSTSSSNQGAASDINFMSEESLEYYQTKPNSFLAEDNYSVKAPGISGSIAPYRLDVGSVAMPREMTNNHVRIAPVKYLDYKVPFTYQGIPANNYLHHVGGVASVNSPTFHYGVTHQSNSSTKTLNYTLDDVVLKDQRINSTINNTKRIPQGNFVEWMSSKEIKNSIAYPSGYLDFLDGGATVSSTSERSKFRTNFNFGSTGSYSSTSSLDNTKIPVNASVMSLITPNVTRVDVSVSVYSNAQGRDGGQTSNYMEFHNVLVESKTTSGATNTISISGVNFSANTGKEADVDVMINVSSKPTTSIGAYAITAANGTTYHFSLPIYEYDNYTEIKDITDPANKKSIIKRTPAFANTWLLTAITGSDFIDRNNNGMVDSNDWGYWVRFHYGNSANDYEWRIPFGVVGSIRDPSNKFDTYSKGKKQLYYLNSIETRSHVALFLKSTRSDGRSLNNISPLKLDEIVLVSKEVYNTLTKPVPSGGYGIEDYTINTYLVNKVCESTDFTSAARTYINRNLVKKVVFKYDYSLCPGTPNSSASGKLTLKRLSVLGRSNDAELLNNRIVPDYVFEYNNPNNAYNRNAWDAWGYYTKYGAESGITHQAVQEPSSGTEWSLNSILTPQGSRIRINYERDSYNSVSGNPITGYSQAFELGSFINRQTVDSNNTTNFYEGELVDVEIKFEAMCQDVACAPSTGCPESPEWYTHNYLAVMQNGDAVLQSTNSTPPAYTCSGGNGYPSSEKVISGRVIKREKLGGDLRVTSIIMEDEFGKQIKTRYLYEQGTIAQEPGHVLGTKYDFYKYPDYPQTPVMYGRVIVLNGNLATDTDYDSKHVYEFNTPQTDQYSITETTLTNSSLGSTDGLGILVRYNNFVLLNKYQVVDRTAKIGTMKSVKIYDKSNSLVSTTSLDYTETLPVNQGVYSTGTLLFERVNKDVSNFFRGNRTTTLRYPYVLTTTTTTTKDGFTHLSGNVGWDFKTGMVIDKVEQSNMGMVIRTRTRPAYHQPEYAEMGSKADNLAYKNMLSQPASTIVWKSGATGVTGLIGATAQVWSKTWPYREYNPATQAYTTSTQTDVWKRGASYTWRGDYSRLQQDGTHTTGLDGWFNFADPAANTLWQYRGEPTLFNHSSIMLESKNYNSTIFSAIKMGYDNRHKIAEATNAKYDEIAFSSAEDLSGSEPFFGGEVGKGNGSVLYVSKGQTTAAHTGDAVVSLSTGTSFVFKPVLTAGKTYKISVWTNNLNGRLYYKTNGGAAVVSNAPSPAMQVGNWYLLNFSIPNFYPTPTSCEVGVMSSGGTVLFDDFRFQPMDAMMTCYVHNPLTYEHNGTSNVFEYVLDNDNLYTKFEYNNKGELIKVYSESLKYGEKLLSETRVNFRRDNTNR